MIKTFGAEYDTNYYITVEGLTRPEFDVVKELIATAFDMSDYSYDKSESCFWTPTDRVCANWKDIRDEILKAVGRPVSGRIQECEYTPSDDSHVFDEDDFNPGFSNNRNRRVERMTE